jgi:hypothetical protein
MTNQGPSLFETRPFDHVLGWGGSASTLLKKPSPTNKEIFNKIQSQISNKNDI